MVMRTRQFVMRILMLSAALFSFVPALGQEYPRQPIRLVTTAPGSGNDFIGRLIAQGISAPLGRQVVVDNRAGQIVPGEIVSKSLPDGYTLLISSSTLWLAPFLQLNVPYDPVRDFSPVALATTSPNILVVHPSIPAKSVKELVALAKAKPQGYNVAATVIGGSIHLSAELFKAMTGTDIVTVPFKGVGGAITAVIGGEVQIMFPAAPSVTAHIDSGRLRALAVTTEKPSALAPGLPTVAASIPGFESGTITGIWAPAMTPQSIINQLNREIARFLERADTRERLFTAGAEAVGSSPQAFATVIRNDMSKWEKVIKSAGIRAE